MNNLFSEPERSEDERLYRAGCEYAGCFCGVEMWRLPNGATASRREALAWLRRREEEHL